MHTAYFERFDINMTLEQAESVSHPGDCFNDVSELVTLPEITSQLDIIGNEAIQDELREYGAWSDDELLDYEDNRIRIIWIAGGNITNEEKASG